MLDKIFNILAQFGISVIILYGIFRMFEIEINERSITAIILTICAWYFAGCIINSINK